MARARVLVIEDSTAIRSALEAALHDAGYTAVGRPDGGDLSADLNAFRPDVVLLDVMLPGRDGFTLLREIRQHCDAGVLMVTARDGSTDRVRGLTAGADDYIPKPFDLPEVIARVGAVLRRTGRMGATVEVGDLVVDPDAGVAIRAGHTLSLTATEFRMLSYFAQCRGRVLSKTQVLTAVWGYEGFDPNLVEVHVSALRKKLEQHGPRLLHTERGLGYILRAPPSGRTITS
ncbi:response regulator transcription factor [Tsukamurella sp. 8F]|uniref:response regulator transcription factor n=1 Tax=unclassified Tsukamurella TaxID=2633480 RepID=UPI0023B9C0F0|nr:MULTISPECIES: response regulator transcription factor [unclassified Tsukamurella]MDF0529339.1 response regulator transcription factor [Tsukamurella sp. 8J]MDF0587154.1 response regulator transcription factor [Tsukamurella sp. 8F]